MKSGTIVLLENSKSSQIDTSPFLEFVILTLNSSLTSKCQLSALILRVECGTAEIFVFQLVSASTNATSLAILHCKDSFTHAKNIIVFFTRYKV